MEAAAQILTIVTALIGVVSALLTLYAKSLDVKKAARRNAAAQAQALAEAAPAEPRRTVLSAVSVRAPALAPAPAPAPVQDAGASERALALVRGPALAVLIAGTIGLFCNLFMAGFGYVDEFVTPLSTQTQQRRALEAAARTDPSIRLGELGGDSARATAVMGIVTLLSFAVISALAIWAGYGMLRLRSYWFSVAGSVAIMPGAAVCCFAGLPIGIWSLTVLFRPEVAAAFQ
jgi:hypothetical protein